MRKIAILGSTGSIGTQTLDVLSGLSEDYEVVGLSAGTNLKLLIEQALCWKPAVVSLATEELAAEARAVLPSSTRVLSGEEGLMEVAAGTAADYVVTAVVGSKGLGPTLAAIEAGKQIGLANKETLITAGHLVTAAAKAKGVSIIPIDSEHSAILQCLNGEFHPEINKITLTASGGSFRSRTREQLAHVTVADALKHPNWSMGSKITIDSATMMNKGLEVIEAHWLFGLPYDRIEVIMHPQSVIHSYVEFVDNSVMAQLGNPDMRVPIQYALTYPHRLPTPTAQLDLRQIGKLEFLEMDLVRFPCLRIAYEVGRAGGTAPTVCNAANEVAVARFLNGHIGFLDIEQIIERIVSLHIPQADPSLEEILYWDNWARNQAAGIIF